MRIAEPKVTLLAHTGINREAIEQYLPIQGGSTDTETLTVFAGRSCYESWSRPNKATFHDVDYLNRTLFEQRHFSILEHASATLYMEGVSRALLTELTRHRHLSFSVRSQRFVDESECNVVMPPAIREADPSRRGAWGTDMEMAIDGYRNHVAELSAYLPRKQAREASRSVLPNAVETRIVVTGNLRAWHEVIERRTQPDADAEIQEVMRMAKAQLAKVSPVLFGDDHE